MKTLISNVLTVVYIVVTLFLRIYLEPQFQGNYFISLLLGLFAILFLWAMIKSDFIRPTLFGLDKIVPLAVKNK